MTQPLKQCTRLTRFDQSSIDPAKPWQGNLVPERKTLAETLTKHFAASGGPYVLAISSATCSR